MNKVSSISRGEWFYRSVTALLVGALFTTVCDAAQARSTSKTAAPSANTCVMADDAAVADLFRKWNLALATLDSSKVAALYWPNAVLLPTVSNVPRTDTALITDYFDHFLKKSPRGTIVRRITHHACNVSVDAGLYDFSVMDPAGNASTVSARYTFVYTYRDGEWKIQHHHSSAMPEPVGAAAPTHHDQDEHAADHSGDTHEGESATQATAEKKRPAATESSGQRLRIQLDSATRTPSSYLNAEQRRKVGRETVGIKVCTETREGERTFTVSDAAPHAEANEAAIAWAKNSRWTVSGTPTQDNPACAQVVVRFADLGV